MRKVTVFMPVYNAEKYIRESINSILNQTYVDFNFVIIDDGSTDDSLDIIKTYKDERIKLYLNKGNMGVAYTRNRGLQLCETEYIAFMDADDIAPLDRIQKEVDYLDKHPEIIGVGGIAELIDENGKSLNKMWPLLTNPVYLKAYMIFKNTFANGSMMLRYDIIKDNNLMYRDYVFAEDYCFFCELLQYGVLTNLNEIMQKYRVVQTGLTANSNCSDKNKKQKEKVLKEILEYNLSLYEFSLDDNEKNILFKVFYSDERIDTMNELVTIFKVLKMIVEQSQEKKLDIAEEIKTVCRKQFGKKIEKCFMLWEK